MKHILSVIFNVIAISSLVSAQVECGPPGTISISGSSTVEPIAKAWAEGYTKMCPNVIVNIAGGGSSVGARAVCNSTQPAVDIGNMSREWRIGNEANVTDASKRKFICNVGTTTRSLTQIDVAIDGLTVAVLNGGLAAKCFRTLEGRGLTIDQLRWIFSNYTYSQLLSAGWDATSVPFNDGFEITHYFREFSRVVECENAQIRVASPGSLSGTYDFFKEHVFPNFDEGLPFKRPFGVFTSEIDEELVEFLKTSSEDDYGDAISFFGHSYFQKEGTFLYGLPIRAPGENAQYYVPSSTNIEAGVYKPFSRRIYMNVLDDSLASTGPFISYGLSPEGITRMKTDSFIPPPRHEIGEILSRIGRDLVTAPPTKSPTRSPITPPTKVPIEPSIPICGMFSLSIFCPFTFCGFFGRLVGVCAS